MLVSMPLLAGIVLMVLSTAMGLYPVIKIIRIREAKHELRHGSAGALRAVSGWVVIAFWLMATWFCATILGDWHTTGDLAGAIDRAQLRLRVLLEIAAALGESN